MVGKTRPVGHVVDRIPDYDLEEVIRLERPEQMGALFDETRYLIIGMLSDKAATVSDLAGVMGKPKGTVGYHMKILEDHGLVKVVRTEKVRGIEAKYYGRTARTYDLTGLLEGRHVGIAFHQAVRHMEEIPLSETGLPGMSSIRYVRISEDRAREWEKRLMELSNEFNDQPRDGDRVYGLMLALFPTNRPYLP
jgi:DNA-binding transcriptional ArsR family regulator